MAQLPLALSGKLFTTMKKALFHGHLRVLGVEMNTSVSLCSIITAKTTRYSILLNKNRNTSTRQKSICGSGEPFTSTTTKTSVSLFFDYFSIRPAPAFQAFPTCSPET